MDIMYVVIPYFRSINSIELHVVDIAKLAYGRNPLFQVNQFNQLY